MQSNLPTNDGSTGSEFARSIANIIHKTQFARGLKKTEGKDLDDAIATWLEILVFNKIPRRALNLCYLHAQLAAAKIYAETNREPYITANALVAAWTNGASDEYFRILNENKKQIGAGDGDPAEGCPRCNGLGLEQIYSPEGVLLGVRAGRSCEHKRLEPGEFLFEKLGGDPRDLDEVF